MVTLVPESAPHTSRIARTGPGRQPSRARVGLPVDLLVLEADHRHRGVGVLLERPALPAVDQVGAEGDARPGPSTWRSPLVVAGYLVAVALAPALAAQLSVQTCGHRLGHGGVAHLEAADHPAPVAVSLYVGVLTVIASLGNRSVLLRTRPSGVADGAGQVGAVPGVAAAELLGVVVGERAAVEEPVGVGGPLHLDLAVGGGERRAAGLPEQVGVAGGLRVERVRRARRPGRWSHRPAARCRPGPARRRPGTAGRSRRRRRGRPRGRTWPAGSP